jgi:predicted methyltransferase
MAAEEDGPMDTLIRLFPVCALLMLAGCPGGRLPEPDPERSAAMAEEASRAATVPAAESASPPPRRLPPAEADSGDSVSLALSSPQRRVADRVLDAKRKGGEVLRFFGIGPGMTVLDLYAGGGYYTELLSLVVGPAGRVVSHNNAAYEKFAAGEIAERYTPGRLLNVEQLRAENNQLELPAGRFDAVLMSLTYHDIYFVDEAAGWSRIDGTKLLAEIHRSMKPGAVLGVIDHVAEMGAPAEVGGTLHRIDPQRLRREITAAGFVLEAESPLLRNPADDHSKPVFDPAVRGQTDRIVLRFRKPG